MVGKSINSMNYRKLFSCKQSVLNNSAPKARKRKSESIRAHSSEVGSTKDAHQNDFESDENDFNPFVSMKTGSSYDEQRPILHGPSLCPPTNLPIAVTVGRRVLLIQKYLDSLQYDIPDTRPITIRKSRPICGLMDCAREIMRESQPIKCMEAVILAIYLTNSCQELDRFPVSFKSRLEDVVHRHVVLVIHQSSVYGALGLSRKRNLMYKPLRYASLAELIGDFLRSYRENGHEVIRIKIGASVPHDMHTYESICWNFALIQCPKYEEEEEGMRRELNKLQRKICNKGPAWRPNLSNLTAQMRDGVLLKRISRKSRKVFPVEPKTDEPRPTISNDLDHEASTSGTNDFPGKRRFRLLPVI